MRSAKELGWQPRRVRPFGAVTKRGIRDFERYFRVRLPREYVKFLKQCNGGRLHAAYVNEGDRTLCEINDLFGLGSPDDDRVARQRDPIEWDHSNLWGELRVFQKLLGENAVPIARDGGGNRIYLDLGSHPAEVWRYVVSEQERYRLAPSFEAFLDMLSTELLG